MSLGARITLAFRWHLIMTQAIGPWQILPIPHGTFMVAQCSFPDTLCPISNPLIPDQQFVNCSFFVYILSSMRYPSIPAIICTLHTFSNTPSRRFPHIRSSTLHPAPRITILRSMPTIPFISSFFSSSSDKMSGQNFPIQKTKGEWQAVLSKGKPQTLPWSLQKILTSIPRAIPCSPREGYRDERHREIWQALPIKRRLLLRRLQRSPLPCFTQVQLWLRLACLLRRYPWSYKGRGRRVSAYDTDGDSVCELWGPLGTYF